MSNWWMRRLLLMSKFVLATSFVYWASIFALSTSVLAVEWLSEAARDWIALKPDTDIFWAIKVPAMVMATMAVLGMDSARNRWNANSLGAAVGLFETIALVSHVLTALIALLFVGTLVI